MEWIKFSKYNLPPQGLKILCFRQGDLWVARRLELDGENFWMEVPYGGNMGAVLTDEPEYWMQLELPGTFTGYLKIGLEDINNGEPITLDEFQAKDPESHREFVHMMVHAAKKEFLTKVKGKKK